jgi:PHD/YefM family antitoxin component YafN of YafNO toxin-antitoxin module
MSLAFVLQRVQSNSAPTPVTATSKTAFRVVTEEQYEHEILMLEHYETLLGLTTAINALKDRLKELRDSVSTPPGRQAIIVDSGIMATPSKAAERRLSQSLNRILREFQDNTTVQFDSQLSNFGDQMRVTYYDKVNKMFDANLLEMNTFFTKLPTTPGIYKESLPNEGSLVAFIDYLKGRDIAIKQRLLIANGTANPSDEQLRAMMPWNYWADPATASAQLQLFIAHTNARDDTFSTVGDYTLKRSIAIQNKLPAGNKMPAPDTDDARALTDQEIVDLIDAVRSQLADLGQVTTGISQARATYAQDYGQQAMKSDVDALGDSGLITAASDKRSEAIKVLTKYAPTEDATVLSLVDLLARTTRWSEAVKDYEKVHMQDGQNGQYYTMQHPLGAVLATLEADNLDRRELNKTNSVTNLWTNVGSSSDGDPSSVVSAQRNAVTNATWKQLIDARKIILSDAEDIYVAKDTDTPVSSLPNTEIRTLISNREPAVTELKKWASGAALATIITLPVQDLMVATAARQKLVLDLREHLNENSPEYGDLITRLDDEISTWLKRNKIDYDRTAEQVIKVHGGPKGLDDWKTAGPKGLELKKVELVEAEKVRNQELGIYKTTTGNQMMDGGNKSIQEIRKAITSAKEDVGRAALKKTMSDNISNIMGGVRGMRQTINTLKNEADVDAQFDSFTIMLNTLDAYKAAALDSLLQARDLSQAGRDELLQLGADAVKDIENLLSELTKKKQEIQSSNALNRRTNAFAELNKKFDQDPGVMMGSEDVVTLNLSRKDVIAKLEIARVRDEKIFSTMTEFPAFEKWTKSMTRADYGVSFLKKYTNIDMPHYKGYIGFIESFTGSDGLKINLCGDANSPFSSCEIGFFHGGVFFSDWARVVPNINGGSVTDPKVVKKNLTEMDKAVSDTGKAQDLGKHLTMPLYINLIDRRVSNPISFIVESVDMAKWIEKSVVSGIKDPVERRSQALGDPKANGADGDPLMFVFADSDGTREDIPLDKVVDNGGISDEVTYLIAPSGSRDQTGSVMYKWFEEVITQGGWAKQDVRQTVQTIVDRLYPNSIYDSKDERTGGTTGAKFDFVKEMDQVEALTALRKVTDNYKSTLRFVRFTQFDELGKVKTLDSSALHLKAIWNSDNGKCRDIKAFVNIDEVTSELRNKGIMVWADTTDLNQYNLGTTLSTVKPVPYELLDTDDEDVVSFRFTPNI